MHLTDYEEVERIKRRFGHIPEIYWLCCELYETWELVDKLINQKMSVAKKNALKELKDSDFSWY